MERRTGLRTNHNEPDKEKGRKSGTVVEKRRKRRREKVKK